MATMTNDPHFGTQKPLEDARRWRVGAISGWVTSAILALALIPATCSRERVGDGTTVTSTEPAIVAPVPVAGVTNQAEGDMATGGDVVLNNDDVGLFRSRFQGLIDQQRIDVSLAEGRTGVRFLGVSFFEPGAAALSSEGTQMVRDLVTSMGDLEGRMVYVEGHADDRSAEGTPYASNWELAAARAATVAEVGVASGLDPKQVAVVSYGDTRPASVDGNGTEDARALNRRVSLAILPRMTGTDAERYSQR
jgi:flagellar motor protein MotB